MRRPRKHTISIFIVSSCLLLVLLIGFLFVSSRLPNHLSFLNFLQGYLGVELKKESFIEVSPNVYFYKEGDVEEVIEHLGNNGFVLSEQIGSLYIFDSQGCNYQATSEAITRWHCIFVLTE